MTERHHSTITDTKQWGAEIAVNGVRPAWLGDGIRIKWSHAFGGSETYAELLQWSPSGGTRVNTIRLPADHFAYKALAAGFEPWGGGDKAPEDWDGKEVLLRNGCTFPDARLDWRHIGSPVDIIGYRKRTDAAQPTPDRDPALWDRMVALVRDVAKISVTGELPGGRLNAYGEEARAIVAELAPPVDPDLIEAREIAAATFERAGNDRDAQSARNGTFDGQNGMVSTALAGIKRGRQLAGEGA